MFNYHHRFFRKILIWSHIIFFQTIYCEQGVYNKKNIIFEYHLKKIMEVDGRQGIATNEKYFVVSGSKELYRYTKQGKLLNRNNTQLKELIVI